jgi:hypothetical protein
MANKGGPKGIYTIHSAHYQLPPLTGTIQLVSIDPGCDNFAIRVERRHQLKVKMLAMSKHIISYTREKCSVGSTSDFIFNVIAVLEIYRKFYCKCDIVLIEDQMYVNESMSALKAHILNYFVYMHPELCVVTISPKLKTHMIPLRKGLSPTQIKKEEVVYAYELCEKRDDQGSLDILLSYDLSKEATDKVHDLCVTINQIEGFCRKLKL